MTEMRISFFHIKATLRRSRLQISSKMLFLKISQYSHKTPVLKSLFKKLQAWRPGTLLKRHSNTGVFPETIGQFLRRLFLAAHLRWLLLNTEWMNFLYAYFICLRILTGKKHPKIKLQRLRRLPLRGFKAEKNFPKK